MTALSEKQIYDLNNSMSAAQNAALGTRVATLESGYDTDLVPAVAGEVEASKLVLVGTNKNIDTIAIAQNGLKIGSGAGTAVTTTAAELNILDGVTSTAAELNILDGVTSSTAELNILDGVTKTFSEINALVGGIAGEYKIARGVTVINADSQDIPTGLTTVVAAVCSFVGTPSLTHMWSTATVGNQTDAPTAGKIRILSFKPTAAGNVLPTQATTPFANVAWIAIGV